MIRVKMMMTLDIDEEEYVVPADGRVDDEIEDFIRETFHDLGGTTIKYFRITSEEMYNEQQKITN